ncbi:peptidoglycan-binding protein [Streptomyces sp. NPDC017979]|uniref:peptidoglycan-binding protein n=1 Tax=Streptomyces sp. NPDC017979 TaxID=3365024 RepID=UPI00378B34FF
MGQERGNGNREQAVGVQLALQLRRWWMEAGNPPRGSRPTQQALACKLQVDQTTLSRYLNPNHPSTAPLRVVEALHVQLGAPAQELERARELCRAALRDSARRQTAAVGPEQAPPSGDADEHEVLPAPRAGGGARWRWSRLALIAAALVVTFAAGMVVQEQFVAREGADVSDGVVGTVASADGTAEAWPLIRMGKEDQYTRGRAVQYLLNSHGHEVRVDGYIGAKTRDAVMAFQRGKDLPADGKVGPKTWPELVKVVGLASEPFEVRAAQELLNNVGHGGTAVSGKFTAETAEDVKYFQRMQHLPVTGRVDIDTWLALLVRQLPPVKAPDYQRATGPLPAAST